MYAQPGVAVVQQPPVAAVAPTPMVMQMQVPEKYCGPITWVIGIFLFPFVCCCPCDERMVPAGVTVVGAPPVVTSPPVVAAPMMVQATPVVQAQPVGQMAPAPVMK